MAFSRRLTDEVLDEIFDDDFELSDEDESNFDGDNDIHALLGESVLRRADVTSSHVDEDGCTGARRDPTSEDARLSDIDMGLADCLDDIGDATSLSDGAESSRTANEDDGFITREAESLSEREGSIVVSELTRAHTQLLLKPFDIIGVNYFVYRNKLILNVK